MRTIVINTSKEARNTKLDILFKAPFDQNSLLWYDGELTRLEELAGCIKQAIINDTDTVDRDYNLIVLVDLYDFPCGNERKSVQIYKALLTKYISDTLVDKLHNVFNLLPAGVSVYFADSANCDRDLNPDCLADNPLEQERKSRENCKAEEESFEQADENSDLVDETPIKKEKRESRTAEQRLIMEMFSWTEDIDKDSFQWKLKISISDDTCIDFSEVFETTATSIKKSHKIAKVLDLALESVMAVLPENVEVCDNLASASFPCGGSCPIKFLTCSFERDNEQNLIEGYFNIFANIFGCVQESQLSDYVEVYSEEKIKELLIQTLKKYKYFSEEENICVDFEPVVKIFENRAAIFKKRKATAHSQNEFKDMKPEEVADAIMAEKPPIKPDEKGLKLRGLDREFHEMVEEIFANYDSEVIKSQNRRIVKSCLTGLWNWRDKQTSEHFRQTVDAVINDAAEKEASKTSEPEREILSFVKEEYEREYTDIINDITDAEHKLAANKNILLETKDLVLKFGDLMRKGRWYWVSFIGAIVAIVASILPFIYIEYYSGRGDTAFHVMYLLFAAGFACLYGIASAIYIGKINKNKRILKNELEKLKLKSENERRESIAALYKYYSDTVVEAESHCLLWREILKRDKENSKKGIKRNSHIKRLKVLIGAVERYITMLKINTEDSICVITGGDIKRFEDEGLRLNAEKSFHSPGNQKIYSVLPEKKTKKKEEEGGV